MTLYHPPDSTSSFRFQVIPAISAPEIHLQLETEITHENSIWGIAVERWKVANWWWTTLIRLTGEGATGPILQHRVSVDKAPKHPNE